MFGWFKDRRRKRIREQPFPEKWEAILKQEIWQTGQIPEEFDERWRKLIQVFVAEKNFEGCNGLKLSEKMKVIVAAYACLLVVGLPEDEYFNNVLSILIYPKSFVGKETQVLGSGVVLESQQARIGEAWYRGPVVLSWSDISELRYRDDPGRNVVLHEFAHQLDMLNGRSVDGTPPLHSQELWNRWSGVVQEGYEELLSASRAGEPTFLDTYGATNRAEFFAVATEAFFEDAFEFRMHHPELYEVFTDYYRLNPANW